MRRGQPSPASGSRTAGPITVSTPNYHMVGKINSYPTGHHHLPPRSGPYNQVNLFFPLGDLDPFSFGEDVDVKLDCVVGELIELGEVIRKFLVWEKVPPLTALEHNVNIPVAVLVTLPVPALLAVVFVPKMSGKAGQVPEAAG